MQSLTVETLLSHLSVNWREAMNAELTKPYWNNIVRILNRDRNQLLPELKLIFNALNSCPPDKVKAVIIGQDPYIHRSEAQGLSFSVNGNKIPPSLRNIREELQQEYDIKTLPPSGNLSKWTEEGVLLLNTILTVREGASNSHKGIGWEEFTSSVIRYVDEHFTVVFLAWGSQSQKLCREYVKNNVVLKAGHPSPLNRSNPFLGCDCFRETNRILKSKKILPVRWTCIVNSIPRLGR